MRRIDHRRGANLHMCAETHDGATNETEQTELDVIGDLDVAADDHGTESKPHSPADFVSFESIYQRFQFRWHPSEEQDLTYRQTRFLEEHRIYRLRWAD